MKQRRTSKAASQLCANVVSAFAKQLQELAFAFSKQQNLYLAELRKRDDRHKQFLFGASDTQLDLLGVNDDSLENDPYGDQSSADSQPLTRAQKQALLAQDLEVRIFQKFSLVFLFY